LELKEKKYFEKLHEIEIIVKKDPKVVDWSILNNLLSDNNIHAQFFNILDTEKWILPLKKHNYFSKPPFSIEKEGYISFPVWPESRFLNRVVPSAPEEVCDIALELPPTNNIRVHEDFTQAACKMPPDLAAKWAIKERKWVEKQNNLFLNLPLYLGELIQHLSEGGKADVAFKLAKTLLSLRSDPDYSNKLEIEKEHEDDEYMLPYYPEPQAKFNYWEYEQILKKNIPALVEAGGISVLEWLCKQLSIAIHISRRYDEDSEKQAQDYSYMWRPAIEENEQNIKHDIKNAIVDVVRDSAEQLVLHNQKNQEAIITILGNKTSLTWSIFRRILLHFLRVTSNLSDDIIRNCLIDKSLFDEHQMDREYRLLCREKLGVLKNDEQKTIIGWILDQEEHEKNAFINRFKQSNRNDPTDEEVDNFVKAWLRNKLAVFNDYLPPEIKKRYDEAVAKVGEAEHPEFPMYMTEGWVGPTSPMSPKKLKTLSISQLVKYLQEWTPTGDLMSDSRDGLARTIEATVGQNPQKYATEPAEYWTLHPKYVRGFIEGFHLATREGRPFSWEPVLQLCQWVIDEPRDFPQEIIELSVDDDREETSWTWTRKRIVNLIEEGLKDNENIEILFEYRNHVWFIIEKLTYDPDPEADKEKQIFQPFDAATVSINTVRGEAMHAVMYYVMWVRKHLKKLSEEENDLILEFSVMEEVRRVLDKHLDPEVEMTLTIRSVYGRWFPWLVAWDEEWAKNNVSNIFPSESEDQELWDVAWGTYVVYNRPYDNVFPLISDEYRKALQRLGIIEVNLPGARNVDENLAQHLMTYYWRGLISKRSGSLLVNFFEVAGWELRGYAIAFIGESLADTAGPVHDDIMERMVELWKWRIGLAQSSKQPKEYEHELISFGKWVGSGKLEPGWGLEQLLAVLSLIGRIKADEKMVEQLASLADKYPQQVIDCFRLMIEGEPDGYQMFLWKNPGKDLLQKLIQGTDQNAKEAAIDLVHRLGAMGHLEFRDILPEE